MSKKTFTSLRNPHALILPFSILNFDCSSSHTFCFASPPFDRTFTSRCIVSQSSVMLWQHVLLFMIPLVIRGSFATSTTTIPDGDSFLAIADSAGIPVESLEAANAGVAASALYVGQIINVPSNIGPATGTPLSNPVSQIAAATTSITFTTLASPPVTSPSGSTSPAASASKSGLSLCFPLSLPKLAWP